jgi:hypothetical protein
MSAGQSRLLLVTFAVTVTQLVGCLGDVWEQAQVAAERKQVSEELKIYYQAWIRHHDNNNRGPRSWQDLASMVPAGLQQSLEAKGYQFIWGVELADMKVGTANYTLAYPGDAATAGGLLLMADGSLQYFAADQFNQKFAEQVAENKKRVERLAASAEKKKKSSSYFQVGDKAYLTVNGSRELVEILEILPDEQYRIGRPGMGREWDSVVRVSSLGRAPREEVKPTTTPTTAEATESPSPAVLPPAPTPTAASTPASSAPPGSGEAPGTAITDDTPLAAGDKVYAYWGGKWVPSEVVEEPRLTFVKVKVPSLLRGGPAMEPSLPRHWLRLMPDAPASPVTAAAPTAPVAAAPRTWTDASGKFTIEARFVSLAGGQVTLEKTGGVHVRMPLEKLSAADQKYVTDQTLRP